MDTTKSIQYSHKRLTASVLMLIVFTLTLFAGVVFTSGCGDESSGSSKMTIKQFAESSKGQQQFKSQEERFSSTTGVSSAKIYAEDNSLVYDICYDIDTMTEDQIKMMDSNFEKQKPSFQKLIQQGMNDDNLAEFAIVMRVRTRNGDLIKEYKATLNG